MINCISDFLHNDITIEINYHIGSSGYADIKKRTLSSYLDSFKASVLSGSHTYSYVCEPLILHNSAYIGKVKTYICILSNEVCDTLYTLSKYLISLRKSLRLSCASIHDFKKLLILDHNQSIHYFTHLIYTAVCIS
jgi:hypothetical protein